MAKTSKINNILLSPLDWGLGHTTRCFPLIERYLARQCNIYIACEPGSASEKILKQAFPQITYLPLKGYNVSYSRTKRGFVLKIIAQIPKIFAAIRREHRFVQNAVEKYKIDLVISDNRYGFYSKKVPSVFITHQLRISASCNFWEHIIQHINYSHINKFTECRVPDFKDRKLNIAGKLSHPEKMPKVPVKYIGPLSRLKKITAEKKYDLLALLSGPEPQRTILENKLLQAFSQRKEKILLVRGLPNVEEIPCCANIEVKNYLDAEALATAIAGSSLVLARAGYTTVMEMICLQKKAVFIPTPGQSEQEYLAKKLYRQCWAFTFEQHEKDFNKCIDKAMLFDFALPRPEEAQVFIPCE